MGRSGQQVGNRWLETSLPKVTSKTPSAQPLPAFQKPDGFVFGALVVVSLVVYVSTAAPTVYFGDSGELTAAAYNLGIAHPPGYPLYLLLGKAAMVLIPFGDPALRMNLMSGFFAAFAVGLVYVIARGLGQERVPAASAALIAAFAATFWSQAVVAEVYTLAALFFCLILLLAIKWLREPQPRTLFLLALVSGLAMTHHVIIAVYFPVLAVFMLAARPAVIKEGRLLLKAVALFALPLLLYLYLPIRSALNPPNDWGNPETLSGMVAHVTARQFGGLFFKHGAAGVAQQIGQFAAVARSQFPLLLWLLPIGGAAALWLRERRLSGLLLILAMVNFVYATAFFITDIEAYFIPFFIIAALFAGATIDWALKALPVAKGPIRAGTGVLALILALLPLGFNWSRCDRSSNFLARELGLNLLEPLQANAVLVVEGTDDLFSVAYLKIVAGVRPDVAVYDARQNIFPIPTKEVAVGDAVNIGDFYQFIHDQSTAGRPVYFTAPIFENLRYEPFGILFRVVGSGETPFNVADPWPSLQLAGLDRHYPDAASQEAAGRQYLARARYLLARDNVVASDRAMAQALAAAPRREPVVKAAATFYMQTNRFEQAEKLLAQAIALNPFDFDSHNMRAMVHHYQGNFEQALASYEAVLRLHEKDVPALLNRGMLYEQMGDRETDPRQRKRLYSKAFNYFESARLAEPANPQANQCARRLQGKRERN